MKKGLSGIPVVCAALAVTFCCPVASGAAFVRTIEAPDGVGDVIALTNALTELAACSDMENSRIWLKPGVYDLSGIYMTSSHHLSSPGGKGGILAGTGEDPSQTVLLGGGESEKHGVLTGCGGGNWGYYTISNLTVTGGWCAGSGGGINGAHSTAYRHLIVSNNYAATDSNGSGGGGCFKGCAYNCLFADNHATKRWGGGFCVSGYSTRNETPGQGAWDCVFVGNTAHQYGGGLAINGGGQCHGCSFSNNTSSAGGGVYVYQLNYTTFNGTPRKSLVSGCGFVSNSGPGSGVYMSNSAVWNVPVSDCEFRFNSGSTTIQGADMTNCVVECNTNSSSVVRNSSMYGCTVRENAVPDRYADGIDCCDKGVVRTNINCLVAGNRYLDEYGKILSRKTLINCTILDNYMPNGGNYGHTSSVCSFFNCVLAGNRVSASTASDVRVHDLNGISAVCMTNCVFTASDIAAEYVGADGTVSYEGLGACRKLDRTALKFTDESAGNYTPRYGSPLRDAGHGADWLLSLVGGADLAENARVYGGGVDIGAYECQYTPPGMVFSVR